MLCLCVLCECGKGGKGYVTFNVVIEEGRGKEIREISVDRRRKANIQRWGKTGTQRYQESLLSVASKYVSGI